MLAFGITRAFRLNRRRMEGQGGGAVRVLLATEDVTEQRRPGEKLRKRARTLERLNANLEEFACATSHDLQAPLRMVSSSLQLLERRYKDDLDETTRRFIDYAVDGAQRMKSLVNSLLQYSRVGRKEKEFGELIVDELVQPREHLRRGLSDLSAEAANGGAGKGGTPAGDLLARLCRSAHPKLGAEEDRCRSLPGASRRPPGPCPRARWD